MLHRNCRIVGFSDSNSSLDSWLEKSVDVSSMSASRKQTDIHIPSAPPLPSKSSSRTKFHGRLVECYVPKQTKDIWDEIFREAHGADVYILIEDKSFIPAHSSVLSAASPVLKAALQRSKLKNNIKNLTIQGVPFGAVYAFIRFLYSSSYEEEEVKKFALHLLVLSHCYSVPSLKRLCGSVLEERGLDKENVIDVFQLARLCDASRLGLICVRTISKDFKAIASTGGWKAMKQANPALEQELLEAVVEVDSRKEQRLKRLEEKKMLFNLLEATEVLLRICREQCKMIGPCNEAPKRRHQPCAFAGCKGVENLMRSFSGCKIMFPGGCGGGNSLWQLFELHARLCDRPDLCNVPLCRHFKGKMQQQSKKDDAKWKLLASKVLAAKHFLELSKPRRPSLHSSLQ